MTIQAEITSQTRKAVKQVQDITLTTFDNLPKPVELVEKAFAYGELALANAKHFAMEAAKALTPQAATPVVAAPASKKSTKKSGTVAE